MKPRKYIVANKEQELDVLGELEAKGFKWLNHDSPQEWLPSKEVLSDPDFNFPYPIVAYDNRTIIWSFDLEFPKGEIVFDGRKEENMTKKYKVTQEFMNELIKWRDECNLDATSDDYSYLALSDFNKLPSVVNVWWVYRNGSIERNNRLIAIIQWLNGEDVFEVEEPHKFIVRSDKKDREGDYAYVSIENGLTTASYFFDSATKFDTREEAQEWANSHQVIIEVDADGNKV